MKNNAYWQKRMELLEEAQLRKGERYLSDLEKQYRVAVSNIEKDVSKWYQRFADNNQITMSEAKRILNAKELEEFKWDVFEYIKYGEENAINGQWMKQLENASTRVHISRLEALKLQMQNQVEVLYGNQVDDIDKLMKRIYQDGYYHTAWEIQKGFNIGWSLQSLSSDRLDKIISRPWTADGKTFSQRLWDNQQSLIANLQTELAQSVITGRAPDELIKRIAQQFNRDKNKAGRLVMTEAAAFASASQKDSFNELDVEQYEIVSTLDSHTSEICQDLDGEVFDMKDYEVGSTAPPFHPWCRTVTAPYFDDNYGERIARGLDGQTYYVPSDMKYKDWKAQFVAAKPLDPRVKDLRDIYQAWDGKDQKKLAQSLLQHENLPLKVNKHALKGAKGQCQIAFYPDRLDVMTYELDSKDIRDMDYKVKTVFHEMFHAKSNGLEHDKGWITMQDWLYVEETFAESTANYIAKSVGISREIAPAYAEKLVTSLPKLKTLPDFNHCSTIADFGEVAFDFRFSANGNAKWKTLFNELQNVKLDLVQYSKPYISYIEKNKSELVDKLLENMPEFVSYKTNMVNDIDNALDKLNNGYYPGGNEKMIFENALIITMNRLGVN